MAPRAMPTPAPRDHHCTEEKRHVPFLPTRAAGTPLPARRHPRYEPRCAPRFASAHRLSTQPLHETSNSLFHARPWIVSKQLASASDIGKGSLDVTRLIGQPVYARRNLKL